MNLVGVGIAGCVITNNDRKAHKLFYSESEYNDDKDINTLVEQVDHTRQFTIPSTYHGRIDASPYASICLRISRSNLKYVWESVMPLYGISIDKFVKQNPSSINIPKFVKELVRILEFIKILRKHKITHNDIHTKNILIDPATYKMKLIDFSHGISRHIEFTDRVNMDNERIASLINDIARGTDDVIDLSFCLSKESSRASGTSSTSTKSQGTYKLGTLIKKLRNSVQKRKRPDQTSS